MPELTNDGFQVVTLGRVRPNGKPDIADVRFRFPVPHRQMAIKQAVKVDEVKIPGRSGKAKQAVGYEDSEITINLTLVDIEDRSGAVKRSALAQYKDLQAAFRDRSEPVGASKSHKSTRIVPTIYAVQSRLTDACGIKTVLFKSMDVNEQPGTTDLEVTISFVEFEAAAVQGEKRRNQTTNAAASANSDLNGNVSTDYYTGNDQAGSEAHEAATGTESPLAAAYRAGKKAAMGGGP